VLSIGVEQTPAVFSKPDELGREMLWEGEFVAEAIEKDEIVWYTLDGMYRTEDEGLLTISEAFKNEDYEVAKQLVPQYEKTVFDPLAVVNDIVHDNWEMYPIADRKHVRPGSVVYYARCTGGANPGGALRPYNWDGKVKKAVREKSKVLLKHHYYSGLQLKYEPVGKGGARLVGNYGTAEEPKGWFLTKGEPLVVAPGGTSRLHEGLLKVSCPMLRGAVAWLKEETIGVNLGVEHGGMTQIAGMPTRYADINTVYSDQGSEHDNVHVHFDRFKPARNLAYTAVTRARKQLKISGLRGDEDLFNKMELHPESVMMAHELTGAFSKQRVKEAVLRRRQERAAAVAPPSAAGPP